MAFIPRLESLRGIAALAVVSYHVWGQFSDTPSAGWDAAAFYALARLSNGTGAVVGFFVISGFVLARSLEAIPGCERLTLPKSTTRLDENGQGLLHFYKAFEPEGRTRKTRRCAFAVETGTKGITEKRSIRLLDRPRLPPRRGATSLSNTRSIRF
jgi:hypothetical protein